MSALTITWARSGGANVVAISADTVTLRSTIPSPPGSRIEGTIEGGGNAVRFKVHSSKKQEDGTFVIEGRPIDMTRDVREILERTIAPAK